MFPTYLLLVLLHIYSAFPGTEALPSVKTESLLSPRAGPLRPSQDPFYVPPKGFKSRKPGAILKSRKLSGISAPIIFKSAYQLLYRTQDALGHPSATVTTVIIPFGADFSKHLSHQTAYDEADWDCSPSYFVQPGSSANGSTDTGFELTTIIGNALSKGIPVSTSDYEGEKAALAAGPQAAYGVLDSIRAVVASKHITGILPSARTVAFGYSGGSLATEWSTEYAASYAPELNIVGAAMGGLPVNLETLFAANNGTANAGLIPAAVLGLAAAYPNMSRALEHALVPSKSAFFHKPLNECQTGLLGQGGYGQDFAGQDLTKYFKDGIGFLKNPVVQSVLQIAGKMGHHGIPKKFPLYIFKGTTDEVVPPIKDTDNLVKKFCAHGATVKYFRYVNGTHETTAIDGSFPALKFLYDILDGKRVSPKCTTKNVAT